MSDNEDFEEPSAADLAALAQFMPTFDITNQESNDTIDIDPTSPNPQTEEFDFRLFTKSDKVVLQEPEDVKYVPPERPISYYILQPSPLRTEQLSRSVIEYESIMRDSRKPWPGCMKASRVTHVPFLREEVKKARWRPSKRRRDTFKAIKAAEQQKERQREASRIGRGFSRGASRGVASARGRGRGGHVDRGGPAGGYPRKGGPPI